MMILLSVLLPLAGCVSAAAACAMLRQRKHAGVTPDRNAFSGQIARNIRHMLPSTLLGAGVFLVCSLVIRFFTFHETAGLPLGVLIPATVLLFLPHVIAAKSPDGKAWRVFRAVAFITLILVAAEVFVFNMKCLTTGKTDHTFSHDEIRFEGTMVEDGDSFLITGISAINMEDVPTGTRAIELKMRQEPGDFTHRFRVTTSIRDKNIRLDSSPVRIDYTMGYSGEYVVTFHPYEPLYAIRITFDEYSQPVVLDSVRALSAAPFVFSLLRFYLLLVLISGCAAIKICGVHRMKCSDSPAVTDTLFNIVTVVCAMTMALFLTPNSYAFEYDKNLSYPISDPYVQTFHALNNGRVYIDFEADPELENLVNPYDLSERNATGVGYGWDLAYKDGHYYSYFGLAPVLTFYFPYYFFNGTLPALSYANLTFGFFALLFLCLTLRAVMRLMIPDANLLAFLCMLPVSVGAVGIYSTVNFPNNYNLPVSSGMCYLFLCLWMGFSACDNRLSNRGRLGALCISGLGLGLCAMSRPTMAIGAAILIPLFLGILFRKHETPRFRFANFAVFAAPLFVCIGIIFWYNKARFGSILDFGQEYQITVTDIHANRLELTHLPGAFFAYFLQMPRLRNTFPYFELEFFDFLNYGKRFYVAMGIGAFAYPIILLGTIYLPYAIYRKKNGASAAETAGIPTELPVPENTEDAASESDTVPEAEAVEEAFPEPETPSVLNDAAAAAFAEDTAEQVTARTEPISPEAEEAYSPETAAISAQDTETDEAEPTESGSEAALDAPELESARTEQPAEPVPAAAAEPAAKPMPAAVKAVQKPSLLTALQRNAFIILCFVLSLLIAWQDFCLGGVIRRYQFDFMPVMMIGCFVTVLHMLRKEKNSKLRYVLVFDAMAVTFMMFWLLELELIDGNLNANCPNLFDTVAKLFQFWR